MSESNFFRCASGVQIPKIVYGTAWKKDATEALVRQAIQQGFRGIDTAGQPKHYDEAGVGAAVISCLSSALTRSDLYLQTKFTPLPGHDPERIPYDPLAPPAEQVRQSFAASLYNLQTDYVDCLVLHSPITEPETMAGVWETMEALVDAGAARQLGISNCYSLQYLNELCRTARIKPAVVQNRFYAQTSYDRGVRSFCRQQGIVYQSFWTLTANPHVLAHQTVKGLAAEYSRTPAQILFRYLTLEGVVPLTGTKSPAHMREDLEIFAFELTLTERDALTALF